MFILEIVTQMVTTGYYYHQDTIDFTVNTQPTPTPSPTATPNPNPSYPHVTAPLTAFPTPITSPTAPELSYCTVAFLMILAAIVIVCMKRKVNTL